MRQRRRSSRRGRVSPTPQASQPALPWPLLLAALATCAWTLRFIHIHALSSTPVFDVLLGDSKRYVEWAAQIAGGNWMGSGAFYQAPLYPYLLAIAFSVFGQSVTIVRIGQALAGGLACVLVAIAGRSFFNWRAGLAAGVGLAIYPPAIFFDGHIQKASLDLLLMAALLVGAANYQADGRTRWLVLLGVSLGCLTLTRENARALYPVLVVWLIVWNRRAPMKHRLAPVAVFTLATLVPIAPVVVRNHYVAGEFLLSTSQLGSNFYIGNHNGASGTYEPLVAGRGSAAYEQEDAVRLATAAAGHPLSPSEVSGHWLRLALEDIRRDPGSWMRLMFRKLLLSVNSFESMDTESIAFHAAYSPVLRVLAPISFGVILPLAIGGIVITAAEFRRLAVLYAVGLVCIGSVVVFYVLARYRYPVVPALMLFAGAGVAGAVDAWRQRPLRLAAAVACAIAVVPVVNMRIEAVSDETSGNFGTELLRLDRPREAIPLLVTAVAQLPDDPSAHRDLALAYLEGGEPASAEREYAAVVRLQPRDPVNHRELAVAAEAAGDRATALSSLREAARLDPSASSVQKIVELQVRIASLEVGEGRIAEAIHVLQEAAATARSNGQSSVGDDIELTIQTLRRR